MPGNAATINSTRVLRAYRINEVENVLLRHNLLTMNKEKRRMVRITNQDIRLIHLTLDYIQSSSGRSPEGRPPNYVAPKVTRDNTPDFLYGDRIKSKKYGKQRRAQSAHVSFGRCDSKLEDEDSEQGSENGSQSNVPNALKSRPKSSPAIRQRRYGSVQPGKLGGFRPPETGVFLPDTEAKVGSSLAVDAKGQHFDIHKNGTVDPDRLPTATLDLSLCADVIQEENEKDLSPVSNPSQLSISRGSRPTSSGDTKKPQAFVTEPTPSPDPQYRLQTPEIRLHGINEETTVTEITRPKSTRRPRNKPSGTDNDVTTRVNQERVNLQSARKVKPDPIQAWGAPSGSPQKIEEVVAFKGRINEGRNKTIQDKLDAFKRQYPTKRY